MHIPVLTKEIIQCLEPKPNDNFIDCTVGLGGHTAALLERTDPKGRVLAIDADPEALKNAKENLENQGYKNRAVLVCDNYVHLKEIVRKEKFKSARGILFDLGMSSWHLEESGRGFSFQKTEPLDMRYNPRGPLTAEKIINYWSEAEIEKILSGYGEERFTKAIAKEIVAERRLNPIKTTLQLVRLIERAVSKKYQHQRTHFATRTFQALRIAVNGELDNLNEALPQALEILESGGRIAVISFHSLEDRIVKNFFREKSKGNLLKLLTKKPLTATKKEIKLNPRSRSAKLRVAEKL